MMLLRAARRLKRATCKSSGSCLSPKLVSTVPFEFLKVASHQLIFNSSCRNSNRYPRLRVSPWNQRSHRWDLRWLKSILILFSIYQSFNGSNNREIVYRSKGDWIILNMYSTYTHVHILNSSCHILSHINSWLFCRIHCPCNYFFWIWEANNSLAIASMTEIPCRWCWRLANRRACSIAASMVPYIQWLFSRILASTNIWPKLDRLFKQGRFAPSDDRWQCIGHWYASNDQLNNFYAFDINGQCLWSLSKRLRFRLR